MVSSYTANLAAFLVAENVVDIIESVEDFKECGLPDQPKCKATFGAKKGGTTLNFFRVIFEFSISSFLSSFQFEEKQYDPISVGLKVSHIRQHV